MTIIKNPVTLVQSGGINKLSQIMNKTITELTIEDLEGSIQIPAYAFQNCVDLVSVEFPNTLQTIGQNAFYGCENIESNIEIPETVTSIGDSAFQGCLKLSGDLILSDNITNLERYAFNNCRNISSIYIGKNISIIQVGTFQNCRGCTSLTISPDTQLTTIGSSAFRFLGSNTESTIDLILPSTLTTIESYAFENSILKSVTIPNGAIGAKAFFYTQLESVIIGSGVTDIGNTVFAYTNSLTTVTFEENSQLTSIGYEAFRSTGLISITIPASVESVGAGTFSNCNHLESVVYAGQTPNIENNTFYNCYRMEKYDFRNCTTVPTLASTASLGHADGCEIIIPDALYDEWIIATNWVSLTNVTFVKASEANA